jgi:hypothetical protein
MPAKTNLALCPGADRARELSASSSTLSSPATPADPAPDPAGTFNHWAGELLSWPLIGVVLQREVKVPTGEMFLWRAVVTKGQRCLLVCPHRLHAFYAQHEDRLFEIHDGQKNHALLDKLFAACGRSASP